MHKEVYEYHLLLEVVHKMQPELNKFVDRT